jgi:hypothetical protein
VTSSQRITHCLHFEVQSTGTLNLLGFQSDASSAAAALAAVGLLDMGRRDLVLSFLSLALLPYAPLSQGRHPAATAAAGLVAAGARSLTQARWAVGKIPLGFLLPQLKPGPPLLLGIGPYESQACKIHACVVTVGQSLTGVLLLGFNHHPIVQRKPHNTSLSLVTMSYVSRRFCLFLVNFTLLANLKPQ